MKLQLCRTTIRSVLLAIAAFPAAAQTQHALLIGIDDYNGAGANHNVAVTDKSGTRFQLDTYPDLEGSINDARSMQEMLIGKFGFAAANVHLLTQHDETTNAAILKAMDLYLVQQPKAGDTVVLYYAGHGSQRTNSLTQKEGHLDNTLVGSDANSGAFDVRDRQIADLLNRAAEKGIRVTAIYDSCHSGTIARGIPAGAAGRVRYLGYDPRDIAEAPPKTTPPEDRPKNPVLVFSATGPDQLANEWKGTDKPHGAFTVALLDALRELPVDIPARDIYQRVAVIMQGMTLNTEQQPFLSRNARANEPLFGPVTAASHKLRIAVSGVQGSVIALDSGYLKNIGKGSLLTSVPVAGKPSAQIRVTNVDGPGHSTAELVTGGAKVETGDLFDLTAWAPVSSNALKLWMPPSMPAAQFKTAVAEVETLRHSTSIVWVADPAQRAAQFRIAWNSSVWTLTDAKIGTSTILGPHLDTAAIVSKIPPGSSVLVELPPSSEFTTSIAPQPTDAVALEPTSDAAAYLLLGTAADNGIRYSWVRKDVLTLGVTVDASTAAGSSAMCSKNSAYPIRTDWAATDATGISQLHESMATLAKIHGWLELPTPPETDTPFPYHLRLADASGTLLTSNDVPRNQDLHFVFAADKAIPLSTPQRWVYVLDIDCTGAGNLVLGRYSDKKVPDIGVTDALRSFDKPTIAFHDPPYGRETFVLLTTSQSIDDPSVMNFAPVLTDNVPRGSPSPLQQLLESTSHATRGVDPALPPDWSVEYLQVHPIP